MSRGGRREKEGAHRVLVVDVHLWRWLQREVGGLGGEGVVEVVGVDVCVGICIGVGVGVSVRIALGVRVRVEAHVIVGGEVVDVVGEGVLRGGEVA